MQLQVDRLAAEPGRSKILKANRTVDFEKIKRYRGHAHDAEALELTDKRTTTHSFRQDGFLSGFGVFILDGDDPTILLDVRQH